MAFKKKQSENTMAFKKSSRRTQWHLKKAVGEHSGI